MDPATAKLIEAKCNLACQEESQRFDERLRTQAQTLARQVQIETDWNKTPKYEAAIQLTDLAALANLAPVASDLALHQSVPWVCGPFRCWWRPFYYRRWGYYRPNAYYRPYGFYGYGGYGGYGYGYGGYGYGNPYRTGPSSPNYP